MKSKFLLLAIAAMMVGGANAANNRGYYDGERTGAFIVLSDVAGDLYSTKFSPDLLSFEKTGIDGIISNYGGEELVITSEYFGGFERLTDDQLDTVRDISVHMRGNLPGLLRAIRNVALEHQNYSRNKFIAALIHITDQQGNSKALPVYELLKLNDDQIDDLIHDLGC